MFFTQRNARFIDAVIFALNTYEIFSENEKLKSVILAELLYFMSKNNNTSGVMKGFHNGWGGKKGDSKGRIMNPFELEGIPLIDGIKGKSFSQKAEEVFSIHQDEILKSETDMIDVVYADPPYNQHQYSSNYHLLTSAVLNDKWDVGPVVRGSRAGIRKDHNRSQFSMSSKDNETGTKMAHSAFVKFIESLQGKVRYLLVSYNNEGILTLPEMMKILNNDGKNTVDVFTKEYAKFRGGKSTNVNTKVSEIIFVVKLDVAQDQTQLSAEIRNYQRKLLSAELLDNKFALADICEALDLDVSFKEDEDVVAIKDGDCYYMTIDRSLRVVDIGEDMQIDAMQNIINRKLDKEQVLQQYLNDEGLFLHNYDKIDLLLSSLKISKYQDVINDYINRFHELKNSLERADAPSITPIAA